VVADAHTPSLAACEPSHAGVLSPLEGARISSNTSAPCVLGPLGSRSPKQTRTAEGSKVSAVELADELERIAEAARGHAGAGEELAAVIPAEPADGMRVYLCAFESSESRTWIGLDAGGDAVTDRGLVHDTVTIAALCELAEENAGGGDVEEFKTKLEELGRVEGGDLVRDAQMALSQLEAVLEEPPRIASPIYLDRIGLATRRFEQALGEIGASPFADAMKQGAIAVEGLTVEVEGAYKLSLT